LVGLNNDTVARNAIGAGGNGVFGFTRVPDGAGIFGAHVSTGIGVGGLGLIGVSGGSVNGVGVVGVSAPPGAKGGDGVQGITNSELRNGIYGRNVSTAKRGNSDPAGNGVMGFSSVPDGAGILGIHGSGGAGVAAHGDVGVSATSRDANVGHAIMGTGGIGVTGIGNQIGVWGIGKGVGWAGYFTGPVRMEPTSTGGGLDIVGRVTADGQNGEAIHAETQSTTLAAVAIIQKNATSDAAPLFVRHTGKRLAAVFEGDILVTGDITLANAADCAEEFDVAETGAVEPGTLMVLADDGRLEACSSAYDRRVVGVVSGAESYRPGLILDRQGDAPGRKPIALLGKVFCKADARYGRISVGDMLTTSATEGHAMRADDPVHAFGAVIGKALRPLDDGCGLIPVLIALQ
jgi:hypothetical protein